MASFGDAIPRPTEAVIGSTLTVAGAGLVAVPYGFILSAPLFILGVQLLVRGTSVPAGEGFSGTREYLATIHMTFAVISLLYSCILASSLTMAYLLALKRGQSYSIPSDDLSTTLVFWLIAPLLFVFGDRRRAQSPMSETLLRSLYWALHVPGTVVAAMLVAASGVALTA